MFMLCRKRVMSMAKNGPTDGKKISAAEEEKQRSAKAEMRKQIYFLHNCEFISYLLYLN